MNVRTVFAIDKVTVDLGNELLRDEAGQPIGLRRQCFAVLRHLIENADCLVTKDELIAAVWPGIAVTDDSIVQCIHEIRRALGDDGHLVLKTVPKRGYRLVLPLNAEALTGAEAPPATYAAGSFCARVGAVSGVVACIVAAAIFWWPAADLVAVTDPGDSQPAIAILPFDNIGHDADEAYFADGVTEDLITDLSKVPGLLVIARNSVWTYKDKSPAPQVVARELGVRYILDGRVRRDGDRIRINAELVDTKGDHTIWADRYDGRVGDVFALQNQVIGNIVSALAVKLPTDNASISHLAETKNPQAYDALLLGMERLHLDTEEDTLKAVAHFEKAVALDPDYGRAHAAIAAAQLRTVLSDWYDLDGAELDRSHASLRLHLARALKRPTSLAYAVAAEWALQTGRGDEALPFVERARALAPSDVATLLSEARVFNATGRAAEAEADLRLAMRLDPNFAPATLRALSVSLFEQGKYWEAIETVGRIKAQAAATTDDYITMVSSLGHIGVFEGVDEALDLYSGLAIASGRDPMTVQEAQWHWNGDLQGYHRPYVEQLVAGLRKAGVPEGAGTDVSFEEYNALIHRGNDGEFDVDGVPELAALTAGVLFDHGVQFVDVRTSAGYASGHVPRAVNLSLVSKLSKDELMKVAEPNDQIVFYCSSRYCEDSAIAAAKSILWGYSRVYRLAGGVPAWKEADCPTEVASR